MPDLIPVNTEYFIAETGETLIGDGISRFPEASKAGDIFKTADYNYEFYHYYGGSWMVTARYSQKNYYGAILHSINGKDIKSLAGTFKGCKKLIEAPKIPDGVLRINNAFRECESLITAPEIPQSVTMMTAAFDGCKKLVEAPKIPDGVMDLLFTFSGCESMTTAPEIPKSVNHLQETFAGCTAMEGTLVCHANPTTYKEALYGTKITAIEGSCSEKTKQRLMETKI